MDNQIHDDQAEHAFWQFDARRKGYAEWRGAPQSERDAFKAEYRQAIAQRAAAPVSGGELTEQRIEEMNRAAQDQAISGVAPSIHLARAVEREVRAAVAASQSAPVSGDLPEPDALVKRSEWDDAKTKRQSFNGWRLNYGDCDMKLFTEDTLRAAVAAAKVSANAVPTGEMRESYIKDMEDTLTQIGSVVGVKNDADALIAAIKTKFSAPVEQGQGAWHDAVLAECMKVESCYKAADPVGTLRALIQWYYEEASGVSEGVKRLADNYMSLTCGEQGAGAAPVGGELSEAEFLSKRLARVAKLVGVTIPPDWSHEGVAAVAGTILGEIARVLERKESGPVAGALVAKGDSRKVTLESHDLDRLVDMGKRILAAENAAAPADLTQAARDVLAERRRQIEQEGWTPAHDDQYKRGDLSQAAACYALHTEPVGNVGDYLRFWPWPATWWKPRDNRSNLVKSGALILAEIERLDRATKPATQEEGKNG